MRFMREYSLLSTDLHGLACIYSLMMRVKPAEMRQYSNIVLLSRYAGRAGGACLGVVVSAWGDAGLSSPVALAMIAAVLAILRSSLGGVP